MLPSRISASWSSSLSFSCGDSEERPLCFWVCPATFAASAGASGPQCMVSSWSVPIEGNHCDLYHSTQLSAGPCRHWGSRATCFPSCLLQFAGRNIVRESVQAIHYCSTNGWCSYPRWPHTYSSGSSLHSTCSGHCSKSHFRIHKRIYLKILINLHYAPDLGVLRRAWVEASSLVLLFCDNLGQLQHSPLPLLLMLPHHKVHLETSAAIGRLILETVFGKWKEFFVVDLKTLTASESFLRQSCWPFSIVVDIHVHQLLFGRLLAHNHIYYLRSIMMNSFANITSERTYLSFIGRPPARATFFAGWWIWQV